MGEHPSTGRTVLVTGASSGIGRACAEAFAAAGCRLLLLARRRERLTELVDALRARGVEAHARVCDVRRLAEVEAALAELPEGWEGVDVLVNNAGLSRGLAPVHEGDVHDWEEMIDTNVKGLLHVTRVVLPGMVARGSGHVVQIGSIAGREVYPNGNVYCATKHAVDAVTKGLRLDLCGTGVRVSTVDPGLVETEFSVVRFHGDEERARSVYRGMTPLTGADVADAVLWVVSRPPHVQVAEVLLLPADQASSTLVHRRDEDTP